MPEWGRKPQEVRQYLIALETIQKSLVSDEQPGNGCNDIGSFTGLSEEELFQALVGCFFVTKSD